MTNIATETSHDDLTCPLCGYSLRGLIDPRCPECGYAFEWAELQDRVLRQHPYLFEHHPRHNIWSFFKTVLSSQLPGRFWRTLKPLHDFVPRRLALYWLLVALMPMLAPAVELTLVALPRQTIVSPFRASGLSSRRSFISEHARGHPFYVPLRPKNWTIDDTASWLAELVVHDHYFSPLVTLAVFGFAWPIYTFLPLMIFQESMLKARIKPRHLLRCVAYSNDSFFWFALFSMVFAVGWYAVGGYGNIDATGVFGLFAVLVYPAIFYKLMRAYQLYLRFPHWFAVILVSQFISFLMVLVTIAALHNLGVPLI